MLFQKIKTSIKSFKNFRTKIIISHFGKNWISYILKEISKFLDQFEILSVSAIRDDI